MNIQFSRLTSLVALCLSAAVWADAFDTYVADIQILQDKRIQTEIGITAAQRATMNLHADKYRVFLSDLQKRKPTESVAIKENQQALMKLKDGVIGALKEPQIKRLREITIQQYGIIALLDEKVAAKCGVSAAESQKMKSIMNAAESEFALYRKGVIQKNEAAVKALKGKAQEDKEKEINAEMQKRYIAIFTAARKKLSAMLSATQKSNLMALEGKIFKPSK